MARRRISPSPAPQPAPVDPTIRTGTDASEVLRAYDPNVGIQIFGLGGDDLIFGSTKADRLDGGDGNDTISDGGFSSTSAGNGDVLLGGAGNDVITSSGFDTIDGGTGIDRVTIDFVLSNEAVVFGGDFDTGRTATFTSGGVSGSVTNVEALTIFGGNAGDTITLGSVGATVYARNGDDNVRGGAGNDIILGESGNDVISGGGGSDQIMGNAGRNTLTGGAGADIFSLSSRDAQGFDVITDFNFAQGDRLAAEFPNLNFEENVSSPVSRGFIRGVDTPDGLLLSLDRSADATGEFVDVALLVGVTAAQFSDNFFF